ncbi:transmembrane protein 243b isoform X1 [Dunckerocampus dactyliophorus]|uniref:transmembrane protein 243b isoform X1 n=1 Tax=Dunckerocampus dactyliophorus TaxID=161453 RepID=UPI0024060EC2|nr:transmembrane protein 243b isoform X1 [Dunckerocampus dactyliophorus]
MHSPLRTQSSSPSPGVSKLCFQHRQRTLYKDRIVNLAVGGFTSLIVLVTVISSFVFPSLPPRPLNIFFAVCILLACGSTIMLIFWYRQGDLEPKFRNLIYYKLASIVLLCLCANLYFHDVR